MSALSSGLSNLQAPGPVAQYNCCGAPSEPPGPQDHGTGPGGAVGAVGDRPVWRARPLPAPLCGSTQSTRPSPALPAGAA
ncbi:hypothetical protein NDU88_006052 [Pleurodeles waltl]|uniref:Uncharacterized protein n=1 Tax=Pleurodeles waltl TaxID=8319 RepID=A0AAV7LRB1_PLEWA|nr:hypothetical protein NDU88_006052 [Pleurodeles waltl]